VDADPFEGGYLAGDNDVEVYFVGWWEDNPVATSETLKLTADPTFLAAGFSGPVDKVVVHATREFTTSTFVIDDITYTAKIVPEPGALFLLMLGGAILGCTRRRRWIPGGYITPSRRALPADARS
jgi:hypothetical protein